MFVHLINVQSTIVHLLFAPPDGEEIVRRVDSETFLLAVFHRLHARDLAVYRVSSHNLIVLLQFL